MVSACCLPSSRLSAAQIRHRALAGEPQEHLVAHDRAAGRESQVVEFARAPIVASSVATCSAASPSRMTLTLIDMRLVADEHLQRGIDLIVLTVRTLMALDHDRAGAALRPRSANA